MGRAGQRRVVTYLAVAALIGGTRTVAGAPRALAGYPAGHLTFPTSDPSGTVVDQDGFPIAGATVTLLRSDAATGPFVAVPDGSAVMSPANQNNPDTTNASGNFGWDVVDGYYEVTASAPNCTTATTDVLAIPPPALNLSIPLTCEGDHATVHALGNIDDCATPPGASKPVCTRFRVGISPQPKARPINVRGLSTVRTPDKVNYVFNEEFFNVNCHTNHVSFLGIIGKATGRANVGRVFSQQVTIDGNTPPSYSVTIRETTNGGAVVYSKSGPMTGKFKVSILCQ
jgi:carboxypeptidase family protein